MSEFISVKSAKILPAFHLELGFNTGEVKIFDMTPYLDKGVFKTLKEGSNFHNFKIAHRTITWCNGEIDMSPDTLYLKSVAQ